MFRDITSQYENIFFLSISTIYMFVPYTLFPKEFIKIFACLRYSPSVVHKRYSGKLLKVVFFADDLKLFFC